MSSDSIGWIKTVADAAIARIDDCLALLGLEGGKRQGREYLPLNPKRADHKPGSFSINLDSGAWMDGASGDKGGDLVALAAYVWGCKQGDAGRRLAGHLGIEVPPARSPGGRASGAGKGNPSPIPPKPRQAPENAPAEASGPVCLMPIPADAPKPPVSHSRHGKPAGRWAYRDAAGAVCFYHDRYEPKDERKQFSPLTLWRFPDGRMSWQFKAPPAPRPILGLPELVARPQAPVAVVEGEKARDAAAVLLPDFVVVCWQGGAQAVERADWSALAGRDVLLWPDADEPGRACMGKLAGVLSTVKAARVRWLEPAAVAFAAGFDGDGGHKLVEGPALAEGDDAADLAARHWQPAHLALLLAAPGVVIDPPGTAEPAPSPSPSPAKAPSAGGEALPTSTPAKPRQTRGKGQGAGAEGDGEHGSQDDTAAPAKRFITSAKGVFHRDQNGHLTFVCARLEVVSRVRNEHGEGWGKQVAFTDPDGTDKRLIVSAALMSGDGTELERTLRGAGLEIAFSMRSRLLQYLVEAMPEKRARVTDRTGWHDTRDGDSVFVLPKNTFGNGGEEWLYQSDAPAVAAHRSRGELAGWKTEVAAPCVGNSRLVFAVSMAFASPLLHVAGAESGGFHLRSGSSDGKTTALRVGASVCGGADYMQRWRATDNGAEAVAAAHCDGPLYLDEIAQMDSKVVGDAAYMLSNGAGRIRAGRGGGLRSATARWRLLFLSAGEIGLAQHMGEAGKQAKAGQELRLAEIPADAGAGLGVFENLHGSPNGSEFAKRLDRAIAKHYGTAWPAFLALLTARRAELADTLHDAAKTFEARFLTADAAGQARRVASRFALVGAAGELATEWGITGWEPGEAMKAAGACFEAWLRHRGGEGNHEERAMLAQVREFLQRYAESAFTDWDRPGVDTNSHASVRSDRAGYRRFEKNGSEGGEVHFYIFPDLWKTRVCKSFDPKAVAELMMKRGYIEPNKERGWYGKKRTPEGSIRVVHVLPAFLEAEE